MAVKKKTKKHMRLAYKHAKEHVRTELKSMLSDLISDEHHSIIRATDGVDLNEDVVAFLERFERRLMLVVTADSFWQASGNLAYRKKHRIRR